MSTLELFNRARKGGKVVMKVVEHLEGRTRLVVPAASLASDPPPTSPVFFNPAARLNRDISVAVAVASGGSSFCDSMAGVGARGIRMAREAEGVEAVTLVDFNRAALKAARRAAVLNRVRRKCEFAESETSSYLSSRFGRDMRFDSVDVDPFGTPVRYLQAAVSATADGGVLSATATDTAVLCGVYPKVSERRYGATPLNNHFHHETAIRILAGAIARLGAHIDIGAEPVAAHATRHYVRVYVRVVPGASRADSVLGELGFVSWCPACGHASSSSEPQRQCAVCDRRAKVAGPLWVGRLTEPKLVQEAEGAARERGLLDAASVLNSLVGEGYFPPWSYSIERICSSLGVASVPEASVRRRLKEGGHSVLRTPYETTGIKTDAEYGEVLAAVKESTPGGPLVRTLARRKGAG